jgi:hypothetical protein
MMRVKTQKEIYLKLYKVMETPTLLHGSEAWVRRKKERKQVSSYRNEFYLEQ